VFNEVLLASLYAFQHFAECIWSRILFDGYHVINELLLHCRIKLL